MTLISKTDGSIGRAKIDKPAPAGFTRTPDLRWDIPAAEWERIKDALIEAHTGGTGLEIMEAGYSAAAGDVVHVLGSNSDDVPVFVKALATQSYITAEPLYLVEEAADDGGKLYAVRRFGVARPTVGGVLVDDAPVYVTDLGALNVTAGTNSRRVGKVLDAATGLVIFDGEFGGAAGGGSSDAPTLGVLDAWSGASHTAPVGALFLAYTGSGSTTLTLDATAPAAGKARYHVIQHAGTGSGTVTAAGFTVAAGFCIWLKTTDGSSWTCVGGTELQYACINQFDVQGGIVFRGSSNLKTLAPGTSGQFLVTQGAGSDPAWGDVNNLIFGSDARGDLAIRNATKYTRVALGATSKRLRSDGTDALWSYHGFRALSGTSATLTAADELVAVDKSAGNYTLNVPAVNPGAGWKCRVKVKTTGTETFTIARGAFAGSIEGTAGDYTWTAGGSNGRAWIDIESDGTDYWLCQ